MAEQVTAGTDVNAISVTSGGVPYILLESNDGAVTLEMWKNSGSGWTRAGSVQYATDVHGKGGATIGYQGMGIDSSDVLHVVSVPTVAGYGIEVAYNTFNTSTDSWGTWTEVAAFTGSPYTYNRGVSVVCDSSGNVWFAWGESDKKGVERVYVVTDYTGSWVQTDVGTGSGTERNIYIQVDSSDNIHAFWYEFTGSTWNYRQWTSGGGWGTTDENDSSSANFYDSNVVEFGSYIYSVAGLSSSIYEKDRTSAPVDTGLDHDGSYDYCYQTVYNGERYLLFSVISGSYNQLVVYIWTGSQWDLRDTITDNSANVTTLVCAYDTNNQNYTGVEIAYQRLGYIYYHQTFGTPVSNSIAAFAKMGGQPTDNQDAFIEGGYNRGSQKSFIEGFVDGHSAKHVYAEGRWPIDSHKAYTRGIPPIYVDIVHFTSPTSTGTQTYTGDLNGNQPVGAIFLCSNLVTDDSEVDGLYVLFVGATDGVNNVSATRWRKPPGVGAGVGDTICAYATDGSYNSQGVFDSWTTNGIVIDWIYASAPAYDCTVILFAADDPSYIDFFCDNIYIPEMDAGEESDIDIGFAPNAILTFNRGSSSSSNGISTIDGDTVKNYFQLIYEDLPNDWDMYASYSISTGEMTGYYVQDRSYISKATENGFTIKAYEYTWLHEIMYIAIRLDGWKADVVKFDLAGVTPPEEKTISGLNCVPKIIYANFMGMDVTSRTNTVVRPTWGMSAWNDDTMYSMAGRTSNDPNPDEYVGVFDTGSVLLNYDINGSKLTEAIPYSLDPASFTLTINNSADVAVNALVMGPNLDLRRSIQHVYTFGAIRVTPALLWGQDHPTTSQHAFFNVVDAQTSISCWLTGLNPARTDQAAYMSAVDDPLIIAVPFTTSSGTQQITDSRLGGLTPKAAMFFVNFKDSTSVGLMSIGITDGTNQHCKAVASMNDTTSPYLGGFSVNINKVIALPNGYTYQDAGNYCTAAFSQWITNGVEITWSGSYSGMHGVVYLFCGSSLDAYCDNTYLNSAQGTVNVTDPGFEPDTMFILGPYTVDNLNDTDQNGTVILEVYTNDNHSPYPSMMTMWMGNSNYGFGDCYPCPDWDFEARANYWVSFWENVTFTSSGFDFYQDYDGDLSASTLPYLAIKHPGRKSHLVLDWVNLLGLGETEFSPFPEGNWNVYPETACIFSGGIRRNEYGGDEYFRNYATYGFHFLGAGTNYTSISACDEDYYDCNSQYNDRVCKSEEVTDYQIRGIWRWYKDPAREWRDTIRANVKLTKNGWIYDVDYLEETYGSGYSASGGTVGFLFGTFDIYDNQTAYTHGGKVDWPSRTPRGCFLEGTASESTSSQSAFLKSWVRSSQKVYTEGYLNNTSSKGCYLRGSLPSNDNQVAFLHGSINTTDNQAAYLSGTGLPISSKHSFIRGRDITGSTVSAWAQSVLVSSDSQSAYLRNGWDTSDQQSAYLECVPIRTSQSAYAEAAFDGVAWWSIPAFLAGDGVWPFSDDFSLNDGESWDEIKWVTEI